MPDATTVWKVDLAKGSTDEREGTLTLEADALVFAPAEHPGRREAIELGAIAAVRRLRISPVLMVNHREGSLVLRTAFYFVAPPPLRAPDVPDLRSPWSRTSRRRVRREGVQALSTGNRLHGGTVREWERAIAEALAGRA